MTSGASKEAEAFMALRDELTKSPTARNWRIALDATIAAVRQGIVLAEQAPWYWFGGQEAIQAEGRLLLAELDKLLAWQDELAEGADDVQVNPAWAEQALSSLQRCYMSLAALQVGSEWMRRAQSLMLEDMGRNLDDLTKAIAVRTGLDSPWVKLGLGIAGGLVIWKVLT